MTWLANKPLIKKKAVGGGAITARAVALDFANNNGFSGFIGVWQIDFWFEGAKIPMVFANGDYTFGSTTIYSSQYRAEFAFDTTLPKTGSSTNFIWLAQSGLDSNQRIWIRFNTNITIDQIRYNNYHHNGGTVDIGVKDTVITSTQDTGIPPDAYNDPLTGGSTIWTGSFIPHVLANVEDEQIINLT